MHAIGRFAYDERRYQLLRREREATRAAARSYTNERVVGGGTVLNTASQLAQVLGRIDAKEVVPYILMAMQRPIQRGYGDWGASAAVDTWMNQLAQVSGVDLTPLPPWQREAFDDEQRMRFLGDAHDTWCVWYRAHQHQTLETWRAQGLERARVALTGRAIAPRVAAILRLGAETAAAADQEAARRSLATLIAARRLSNAGRRFMRQFATQRGWSLDVDAGVAPNDAP